jgi:hypothetical protein
MILAAGMPLMRHDKDESCRAGQRQAWSSDAALSQNKLPL